MLWAGNRKIERLYIGGKPLAVLYRGAVKIWTIMQAVRSCFGSGVWIADRPWSRSDCWKRNT